MTTKYYQSGSMTLADALKVMNDPKIWGVDIRKVLEAKRMVTMYDKLRLRLHRQVEQGRTNADSIGQHIQHLLNSNIGELRRLSERKVFKLTSWSALYRQVGSPY